MAVEDLAGYRCPECGAAAVEDGRGGIGCGRHRYDVQLGVPDFVGSQSREALMAQVADSFSAQWAAWRSFPPSYQSFRKRWFLAKIGLQDEAGLRQFVERHARILDAGTGIGYKLQVMREVSASSHLYGIDVSRSVIEAARNTAHLPNVRIARADIFHLPFERDFFDAIICDGVLHHTGDAGGAFAALVRHLAPGGEIFIHVYRKMGPIRELTDDLIRDKVTKLSNDEAREFVKQFTLFGEAMAASGIEIDVPEDIPILGIKKGRHNLQRFMYYMMFQCHWNQDLTFDQNNLINFDWFHPAYASRHTEEEVLGWFAECGLKDVEILRTNVKGVTARGRKS